MRRRTLLVLATLLLIVGGSLAVLVVLLRYEPSFYEEHAVESGPARTQNSNEFRQKLVTLGADIYNEHDRWQATFTEAQLNSYFAEDFVESGLATRMLPDGISDPRISVEKDEVRLGFRYGAPPWSAVVSLNFRVWMVPRQQNTVALQLLSLRAGAIPVSAKRLMKQLADFASRQNSERTSLEVSWYRHEGHPVAVLKFVGNDPRPTTQLEQLTLDEGTITITGRSVAPPGQAMYSAPGSGPAETAAAHPPAVQSAAVDPADGVDDLPELPVAAVPARAN